MLSAKENFLETIKKDGKPDRLVKQFEGTVSFLPQVLLLHTSEVIATEVWSL